MSDHVPPSPPSAPVPPAAPPPAVPQWAGHAAPAGGSSSTRTALLVIGIVGGLFGLLVVVALLAAIMLPALASARSAARSIKAQTQLRSIGTAMGVYADENNGAFPEPGADLVARLAPALGADSTLWISPSADAGSTAPSFIVVASDAPLESSRDASSVPLLIENPAIGSRQVSVLFADGHVQMMDRDAADALLRAQPRLFTPTGAPWTPPSR
jgi:prepilin-type processing-associated H-X9-DG protein